MKNYKFTTYKDKSGWTRYRTKIKCPNCKKIRWVDYRNIKKSKSFTGKCLYCSKKYGKEHPNWKGGKYQTGHGYIMILLDKNDKFYKMADKRGYVYEHRYILAKKLNRMLKKYEHVHHLNGIKNDNRKENLELVNGTEHCLITKMQQRIIELENIIKEKEVNESVFTNS